MSTEFKSPQSHTEASSFLKKHEELLDRAKNGDPSALEELRNGSKETLTAPAKNPQSTGPIQEAQPEVLYVAPELRPNAQGVSPAMETESAVLSQEMLTKMISGDLDVTDPNAVSQAMIQMQTAKRKAQANNN